jgi:hypothetical protein
MLGDLELVDYHQELGLRLLAAATAGDLAGVQEALALGADFDRAVHKGSTPLMVVARQDHDLVAALLLVLPDPRPNLRDLEGDTALAHACCCDSLGVVRLLLGVNTGDADAVMLLHKANASSWGEAVALLLHQPNHQVAAINTAVRPWPSSWPPGWAAWDGQLLAPRPDVDVSCVEASLCSALMTACMCGCLEVAGVLLVWQDVDLSLTSTSGCACLVTAGCRNHPSIAALLLARPDAGPNWRFDGGDSLLMFPTSRDGHQRAPRSRRKPRT